MNDATNIKPADLDADILATIERKGALPYCRNRWMSVQVRHICFELRMFASARKITKRIAALEDAGLVVVERAAKPGRPSYVQTKRSIRSEARTVR